MMLSRDDMLATVESRKSALGETFRHVLVSLRGISLEAPRDLHMVVFIIPVYARCRVMSSRPRSCRLLTR